MCRCRYGTPSEAAALVTKLEREDFDEGALAELKNLFNEDRLRDSNEAVFVEDERGRVVAVGLINKTYPCVLSCYTIPAHRRKGYGYALLLHCIGRLPAKRSILIESTNESMDSTIAKLPEHLRSRLQIQ